VANADWKKIKTEYITTDISQRKLAQKYGVGPSRIAARSKAEQWVEQREQYRSKLIAKTLENSSTIEANRLSRLMDTTTKANIMSAVYTAQAAANTTRTVVQAVSK